MKTDLDLLCDTILGLMGGYDGFHQSFLRLAKRQRDPEMAAECREAARQVLELAARQRERERMPSAAKA